MNVRIKALAAAGVACGVFSAPITVKAHVCMDLPLSRVSPDCNFLSEQKVGPCGLNQRGSNVTEFRPGQTITVRLNETIDHPSHYRIAFNPNGQDFEDPTSKDDKNGAHPYVLLDNIVDDDAAAVQEVQVTLPNVTCDKCTLQLIQVMYDKIDSILGIPGFGGADGKGSDDNDDIYYACADLVLKGEPMVGGDAGTATDAGAPIDGSTPSDAGPGLVDASTGGTAGGNTGGTVADSGATGGSTGTAGGTAGTAGGGTGTAGGATTGGSPVGGVGGTAGGTPGGTTAGTVPPGDDTPNDDGCDCAVSDGSPRYGNLVSMSLLGLGLLVRRRRQSR